MKKASTDSNRSLDLRDSLRTLVKIRKNCMEKTTVQVKEKITEETFEYRFLKPGLIEDVSGIDKKLNITPMEAVKIAA